jgi:hypothetical protein
MAAKTALGPRIDTRPAARSSSVKVTSDLGISTAGILRRVGMLAGWLVFTLDGFALPGCLGVSGLSGIRPS